jgi:hypothetical protein
MGNVVDDNARDRRPSGTLDRRFEELAQLGVELLLDARLSEQPSESAEEAGDESHHNSPSDASRILAIAVVWSAQSRVSRFSFARPSAVSA